eukprot:CAMPEP_0176050026 /NCGR_PEP_ID=MMETSP0120_2-20121206/24862_1 /TAXON_ID=160619 /ORGANISM="Kryptoperidinium foliaceum, Strain CCMP 1326" /LENGTH=139 /DNA_ID=CAMNT_0017383457 /DNA_START=92 /DNA_END=511 /DNA_ORIENTATION=-
MSLLAAAARARHRAAFPAARIAKRHLGGSTTGPAVTDLAANFRIACSFFTKPAISYPAFKQQCVSLRIFTFAGVCGGCAVGLMLNPPKSSYWIRYSPSYWWSNLRLAFGGNAEPLMLTEKVERKTDVPYLVGHLVRHSQ